MLGIIASKGGLWAAMLGSAVLWAVAEWQRLQELREQEEAVKELKALRRRAIAASKREQRARQLEVAAWARRLLEEQQTKSTTTHGPPKALEAPETSDSKPQLAAASLDCKDAPPCINQVDAGTRKAAAGSERPKFRRVPSRTLPRHPLELPAAVQWRCELKVEEADNLVGQGDASDASSTIGTSFVSFTQSEGSGHDDPKQPEATLDTSDTNRAAVTQQHTAAAASTSHTLPADQHLTRSKGQSGSPQTCAVESAVAEPRTQQAATASLAATSTAGARIGAVEASMIGAVAGASTIGADSTAAVTRTAVSEPPSTVSSPKATQPTFQKSRSFSLNPFAKAWSPPAPAASPAAMAAPSATTSTAGAGLSYTKPAKQSAEIEEAMDDGLSDVLSDAKHACWCESDDHTQDSPGKTGEVGTAEMRELGEAKKERSGEDARAEREGGEGTKLTLAALGQLHQAQEQQLVGDQGEASLLLPNGELVTADKIEQAVRLAEADLQLAYPRSPYTAAPDSLLTQTKQQLRLSNKACQVVAEKSSHKRRNLVGRKEDNKWVTPATMEQQALSRYRLLSNKSEEQERQAAMTTTPVSQLPLVRRSKVLHEPDLTPMDAKYERAVIGDERDLINTITYALENNKKVFQRRQVGDRTVYTWIAG